MLHTILMWLDELFGRDIDTITSAFNKTQRQLDRYTTREQLKRTKNEALRSELTVLIAALDKENETSVAASERAARIQARIREITA